MLHVLVKKIDSDHKVVKNSIKSFQALVESIIADPDQSSMILKAPINLDCH